MGTSCQALRMRLTKLATKEGDQSQVLQDFHWSISVKFTMCQACLGESPLQGGHNARTFSCHYRGLQYFLKIGQYENIRKILPITQYDRLTGVETIWRDNMDSAH